MKLSQIELPAITSFLVDVVLWLGALEMLCRAITSTTIEVLAITSLLCITFISVLMFKNVLEKPTK